MPRSLYPDRCLECPVMFREDYGAMSGRCAECQYLAYFGLGRTPEGNLVENRPHDD